MWSFSKRFEDNEILILRTACKKEEQHWTEVRLYIKKFLSLGL